MRDATRPLTTTTALAAYLMTVLSGAVGIVECHGAGGHRAVELAHANTSCTQEHDDATSIEDPSTAVAVAARTAAHADPTPARCVDRPLLVDPCPRLLIDLGNMSVKPLAVAIIDPPLHLNDANFRRISKAHRSLPPPHALLALRSVILLN